MRLFLRIHSVLSPACPPALHPPVFSVALCALSSPIRHSPSPTFSLSLARALLSPSLSLARACSLSPSIDRSRQVASSPE
eukprot:2054487-Pleurochrysis_carterae.AAC.1